VRLGDDSAKVGGAGVAGDELVGLLNEAGDETVVDTGLHYEDIDIG